MAPDSPVVNEGPPAYREIRDAISTVLTDPGSVSGVRQFPGAELLGGILSRLTDEALKRDEKRRKRLEKLFEQTNRVYGYILTDPDPSGKTGTKYIGGIVAALSEIYDLYGDSLNAAAEIQRFLREIRLVP